MKKINGLVDFVIGATWKATCLKTRLGSAIEDCETWPKRSSSRFATPTTWQWTSDGWSHAPYAWSIWCSANSVIHSIIINFKQLSGSDSLQECPAVSQGWTKPGRKSAVTMSKSGSHKSTMLWGSQEHCWPMFRSRWAIDGGLRAWRRNPPYKTTVVVIPSILYKQYFRKCSSPHEYCPIMYGSASSLARTQLRGRGMTSKGSTKWYGSRNDAKDGNRLLLKPRLAL